MLKKLFIRTWFGPLPDWYEKWLEHVETLKPYGFEFLVVNDYDWFHERVRQTLGISIPPYEQIAGTRKAGDYDPAYGVIFANELREYDFWGHCGLDVVFGRLDRFVSDTFLKDVDVFGNDPGAICGPFSLYRNTNEVNRLFQIAEWETCFADPVMWGFDEIQFSEVVKAAPIRFKTAFWQSHDFLQGHIPTPRLSILPDGTLFDCVTQTETMMFHFHRFRQWPVF